MTSAQRTRRLVFWALLGGALARLSVLGETKSWKVVAPVALRVTALTLGAWFAHVVLHECGHLLGAVFARFQVDSVCLGPVEWNARTRSWSWSGFTLAGRIHALPQGALHVKERLRLVAFGGPAATLLALACSFLLWSGSGQAVSSALGVTWVTGLLVVASACTPGRFRASTAVAGNDIDQVLGGRRILAHWTYLSVVQCVLAGGRPRDITPSIHFSALLPRADEPPEPITLVCAIHHLEHGEFSDAQALLQHAGELADRGPAWLRTDVFHQLGAIGALIDGQLEEPRQCLAIVRNQQSLPWYSLLLEACIAKTLGDDVMASRCLDEWLSHAKAPGNRLAMSGNEWIVERLRRG